MTSLPFSFNEYHRGSNCLHPHNYQAYDYNYTGHTYNIRRSLSHNRKKLKKISSAVIVIDYIMTSPFTLAVSYDREYDYGYDYGVVTVSVNN